MSKQIEALKLALEALEDRSSLMKWQKARDAVKEALAQQDSVQAKPEPEQEPVACIEYIPCCTDKTCSKCKAAAPTQRTEQNFCPRCGKRNKDIHTCTPPQD